MRKNSDHLPRFIYKITNLLDEKCYIGITLMDRFDKRMNEHIEGKGESKNYYIHRAIEFYGVENFIFEKIDCAEDLKDAHEKEVLYIDLLKSLSSQNGYNMMKGGNDLPRSKKATTKKLIKGKVYTSTYLGVSRRGDDWFAKYDKIYIGSFPTELDAYLGREKFIQLYNKDNLKECFEEVRPKRKNSFKYTGVILGENKNSWRAIYSHNCKTLSLGTFDTEKEAYEFREEFLRIFNGNNFKEALAETKLKNPKYKYRGVIYSKSNKCWQTSCRIFSKLYYVGQFDTQDEAYEGKLKFLESFNGSNLEESRDIARNKKSQ